MIKSWAKMSDIYMGLNLEDFPMAQFMVEKKRKGNKGMKLQNQCSQMVVKRKKFYCGQK